MEHIASTGQGPLFAENSSSRRTFTSSRDLGVYIDLYSLSPIDNAVQGLSGYLNLTFNPTVLIPTNAISFLGLVERGLTVNVFFKIGRHSAVFYQLSQVQGRMVELGLGWRFGLESDAGFLCIWPKVIHIILAAIDSVLCPTFKLNNNVTIAIPCPIPLLSTWTHTADRPTNQARAS